VKLIEVLIFAPRPWWVRKTERPDCPESGLLVLSYRGYDQNKQSKEKNAYYGHYDKHADEFAPVPIIMDIFTCASSRSHHPWVLLCMHLKHKLSRSINGV